MYASVASLTCIAQPNVFTTVRTTGAVTHCNVSCNVQCNLNVILNLVTKKLRELQEKLQRVSQPYMDTRLPIVVRETNLKNFYYLKYSGNIAEIEMIM